MRRIKVAIIVDPMGSGGETDEDEVARHKREFAKLLKPAEAKFYRAWSAYQGKKGIEAGTDLVVYDFGGMMPGASDLLESNARGLIRWAIEHPSSLAVVVSGFTYRSSIKHELEQLGFGDLPNVVCDDGSQDDVIPQWFRDHANPPSVEKADFCERCHARFDDPLISHTGNKNRCIECRRMVCDGCLPRDKASICLDCAPKFKATRPQRRESRT